MSNSAVYLGDCVASMAAMSAASVDSIVTDPPYELGFMGKTWDASGIAYSVEMWREALRLLKPGGHLLAFSGSRTYHRMVCAIEDAGFEIRDQIMWVYGSGFPKSHNLDGDWKGWGTALKPAHEPIVVARKPLIGTVASNVSAHGTGAINVDGCRVMHVTVEGGTLAQNTHLRAQVKKSGGQIFAMGDESYQSDTLGRWPANLIHDGSDEVLAAFPQVKTGALKPYQRSDDAKPGYSGGLGPEKTLIHAASDGSAARFFYCAKASKADRSDGNTHPTVKPTDLMRYLCRLVTPPGGVVLDPFMGSGSTGKACMHEGFRFIGCELSPEYMEIALRRIEQGANQGQLFAPATPIPEQLGFAA